MFFGHGDLKGLPQTNIGSRERADEGVLEAEGGRTARVCDQARSVVEIAIAALDHVVPERSHCFFDEVAEIIEDAYRAVAGPRHLKLLDSQ